jgi:superfamily II DNA or RNA helicase
LKEIYSDSATKTILGYANSIIKCNNELVYLSAVGKHKNIKSILNKKFTVAWDNYFLIKERYNYKITKINNEISHIIIMLRGYTVNTGRNNNNKEKNSKIYYIPLFLQAGKNAGYLSVNEILTDDVINMFYNEISRISTVPFLKEWTVYILREAFANGRDYVASCTYNDDTAVNNAVFDRGFNSARVVRFTHDGLIAMISYGLKNNYITIGNSSKVETNLDTIKSLDEYLDLNKDALSNKIVNKFTPKFNPEIDDYDDSVDALDNIIKYKSPIVFYDEQKNAIQGVVKNMDKSKHTILSAECGSGKTSMAIAAICAHAKKHKNSAFTTLVMCPSHITGNNTEDKNGEEIMSESGWKKEIDMLAPMSECIVINSLGDFIKLEDKIKDKTRKRSLWIVVSKDIVKSSYSKRPAANFKMTFTGPVFVCPHCNSIIQVKDKIESYAKGKQYEHYSNAPLTFFEKENSKNDACVVCNEKLWTTLNKNNTGDWVKFQDGWYHKKAVELLANQDTEKPSNFEASYKKYKNGTLPSPQAPVKFSIGEYIRKHFKHEIDYLIADEVHELANETLQGKAFADICRNVWKTLSLTGTLFNGRADSIFYLLFRTKSNKMIRDGYDYHSKNKFAQDFGVTKKQIVENGKFLNSSVYNNANIRRFATTSRKTISNKKLPGISPSIFSKYLIDNTIFLKLKDITSSLSPYREIPIAVEMDTELESEYTRLKDEVSSVIKRDNSVVIKQASHLNNALMYMNMYLDQPYGLGSLMDERKDDYYTPRNLSESFIRNKEEELINICMRKKAKGEKFLIYYHFTNKLNICNRLKEVLNDAGLKVTDMTNAVKNNKRQEYLLEQAKYFDGVVLNPALIETGANLLPYTTIIFYEYGTKAFTIRQTSRRSWRLNQNKPVEVYFLYYKDTIQEQMLSLISAKLKAANAIEGDFNESGLIALSQNDDIATELAKSLINESERDLTVSEDSLETAGVSEEEFARIEQERLARVNNHVKRLNPNNMTFAIQNKAKQSANLSVLEAFV